MPSSGLAIFFSLAALLCVAHYFSTERKSIWIYFVVYYIGIAWETEGLAYTHTFSFFTSARQTKINKIEYLHIEKKSVFMYGMTLSSFWVSWFVYDGIKTGLMLNMGWRMTGRMTWCFGCCKYVNNY